MLTALSTRRSLSSSIAGLLVVLGVGCRPSASSQTAPVKSAGAGVTLKLAVVDDPALATAIGRLKGEWKALSGGGFEVRQLHANQVAELKSLEADAVIYPAGQIGLLAERNLIEPPSSAELQSKSLARGDVFELLQLRESSWGPTTYAVSFGSPVFTCMYRADLLEKLHRAPPETWTEYQELAELLSSDAAQADAASTGAAAENAAPEKTWRAVAEPLGPGWGGRLLLARAASYAKHRDKFSTLFDLESMQPLIAGPAFVRALEELCAAAKLASPAALQFDPQAARRELFAGRCALAISWPTSHDAKLDSAQAKIGFSELPGAEKVFNAETGKWENRLKNESNRVPLLGVSGRLGSICHEARYSVAAFELLAWLSGPDCPQHVSLATPAATIYRASQVPLAKAWLPPGADAPAAKQYAKIVQEALSRPVYLFALRLPGEQEYFSALDEAVAAAVSGTQSAADSLNSAAEKWAATTKKYGVDEQRRAYQRSLGLPD